VQNSKERWKCLKEHYALKDSMVLQMAKQELKKELATDYIAHLIAVFTALGEVLEDKEVVLQYAFGCQPEYMVAYPD
jgi:hypothetical protein